jgi:hypothetical protein
VRSEETRSENEARLGTEETSRAKDYQQRHSTENSSGRVNGRWRWKRVRKQASHVASSGRRYFRVTVIVIVNELSNKQLHLIHSTIHFVMEPQIHDKIWCQKAVTALNTPQFSVTIGRSWLTQATIGQKTELRKYNTWLSHSRWWNSCWPCDKIWTSIQKLCKRTWKPCKKRQRQKEKPTLRL